ncbi:biopolymer transporter ExbD [Flavobacterium branchiophilum NBRC 15030 = ATCC 35035]|uniref:Biopolymer transport ExbD1 protein n=2 Tax=Flavobacterium branchiophilum TaxID=55197 RepID=G2Z5G0_FLABF|nr:biopolymer transporter ExbD [Flavobacterium branchiophilum]OXA74453.1 biopolymer transporter ExbD [Flavobacterium branchiophilum NBRC 15030 = ATCC 35035]TQM41055.1 outer membrane transport energization protein ExbD [Flavobacterium branchiophilum]GEM54665.1 biopolymer transporter ExbD [Flavobacterium branchiophilum NBRC 15030 = ATCC 35035]CCB68676.1 Biopolymer transport ExbD1 protein [Flavobacterium branchiophilum FL-15]
MAKVKMSKKAASIDMTAMCDVAFLLLTFFILTATAKQQEALTVDAPSSTVQTKLPENDLATLTVGKGKVFFGVTGREVRKRTLELMAEKYGVTFTPEEYKQFSLIETFGTPVEGLKSLLAMKNSDRNKEGVQPGIPKDSTNNQLKEWIYNARVATKELDDKPLAVAIKGDAKQEYPQVKKIMDILQDQNINNFNLVTGLRGKDF